MIGLAPALAAQDRGARVTVLEAEAPGAEQSVGPGRIFRHIHDRDELVALAVAARRAWEEAWKGQTIRIVFEAVDGASNSLLEVQLEDVRITRGT